MVGVVRGGETIAVYYGGQRTVPFKFHHRDGCGTP
jgi:hypothetical protein